MDKLIVRDIRRRPFLWMEREAFARIVLQSDPRKSRVSTRTVLSVYMALAYYENGRSHTVAVRASTIAHQLGISRRQFDRAVKVLCDLKLITVTSGKDNGKPNIYTLLDIVEGEDVGDSPEGLDSSVQPPQGGATPVSKGLDTSVQGVRHQCPTPQPQSTPQNLTSQKVKDQTPNPNNKVSSTHKEQHRRLLNVLRRHWATAQGKWKAKSVADELRNILLQYNIPMVEAQEAYNMVLSHPETLIENALNNAHTLGDFLKQLKIRIRRPKPVGSPS